MNYINIYTDGSCRRNGKVGASGGCGVYIDSNVVKIGPISIKLEGKATNQRAELTAMLIGINCLFCDSVNIFDKVNIYTDSLYVKNAISEWINRWKKNNWKTTNNENVKNQDLLREIDNRLDLLSHLNIKFHHIYSHRREPKNKISDEWKHWYGNNVADKLATSGADK